MGGGSQDPRESGDIKSFGLIFLHHITKQLPWNDILAKKQGGWGGVELN